MVCTCQCFSFFVKEIESDSRIQTNSTTADTFYTAQSDLNGSVATDAISDPPTAHDFAGVCERSSNLRVFTLAELKEATRDFDTEIGKGGFGIVYRGVIKSSEDPLREIKVAVKKQKNTGVKGNRHWVTEVNFLGKVEHQNLVKLVGYCAEDEDSGMHRLLVYEYMPNGSLEDWLSGKSKVNLSWPMRLKVAIDAARGLAYLHEETDESIIFRDFKPSNILLDEQWNAKLSDFGCARLGPTEENTHVTTRVRGTYVYMAPEYKSTGHLRTDSDVWSYGVFLYVLITGRSPYNPYRPPDEQNLLEWVTPYLCDEKFSQIIDPRIEGHFPLQLAKEFLTIANKCLDGDHTSRPKMSIVVEMLDELKTKYSQETVTPLVPEGATDNESQSPGILGFKGKGRFVCFPQICGSKT